MALRFRRAVLSCAVVVGASGLAGAGPQDVQTLVAEFGAATEVTLNPATGAARFVRLGLEGTAPSRAPGPAAGGATPAAAALEAASADFLARHGRLFGLADARAELFLVGRARDAQGGTHLTYQQRRGGVPVFAAILKTHFDAAGALRVVNGITVPDVDVSVIPSRGEQEAARTAEARVRAQGKGEGVVARETELVVYRTGLVQGIAGANHLAWRVEVGNGEDVREFVFVDAHTGKFLDQFTGVLHARHRRAYNHGSNFPDHPYWVEGDSFPTADSEANEVISTSGETYDLYSVLGRDSFDGAGGIMHAVFRQTGQYPCPNASWAGTFTSYCPGTAADDVIGHEWTHAYSQYTHGLVYAWQPGALNEAYSDIFGEVIDLLNGRGTDDPAGPRSPDGTCSEFTGITVRLRVNAPGGIAGDYAAASARFGPYPTQAGTTGDLVLALDAADGAGPRTTDACSPITNAADVAGRIALVDRGTCVFVTKARNVQAAGAIGMVMADNVEGPLFILGGSGPDITIPAIRVTLATGDILKGALAHGAVNGTVLRVGENDRSYRWLLFEDATSFAGAIRDMWAPGCYGDPGKVSDALYHCGPFSNDGGGVHHNSGIPNHAFALLVDGGHYNGQVIAPIGLVKATHVYYRAMTVYQGPASNFADHADAIEQSCRDLIGASLADLVTGAPSEETISASDCQQVARATLAVELRTPPVQCHFQELLAKNPPERCEAGTSQANVYASDFETDPIGSWTVFHTAATPDFTPRDWTWTGGLPDRDGSALFGLDFAHGTCAPGGDESGVLHAVSPAITLPAGAASPRLTFDHWVSAEEGWDGGNVKISVNGGPWQVVAAADFTYNAYNMTLFTVDEGNTNPMAGQPGFSGSDGGSAFGSWGRSHVDLAPYAAPGDVVRLRFDLGTDGCTGLVGWYLDDPTLYACVPSAKPALSIGDVSVVEGNSALTNATFHVSLSHPSPEPVTVWYVVAPGSADLFSDILPDVGTITIPPLGLQQTLDVKVKGDTKRERDETFTVWLFLPQGGTLADDRGQGTIVNDDVRR
jgi:Zn-dependent metalloprotease